MSDSLQPHGLKHARPPCPSPTPGVYSHSCQLSRWCHPTISSCLVPFSPCPQSFSASGSFPVSQISASGGQSSGVSASSTNSSALSFTSHYYTCIHTTGKTRALTRWTFGDKVMSLHLIMHSRTPFHNANANNHKRGNQQQHNNCGISSPHLHQQTVLPQRKSIRKQALNETISHTDLNAIYRTLLQQQENSLSSQVHMEHSLG